MEPAGLEKGKHLFPAPGKRDGGEGKCLERDAQRKQTSLEKLGQMRDGGCCPGELQLPFPVPKLGVPGQDRVQINPRGLLSYGTLVLRVQCWFRGALAPRGLEDTTC